MDREQYNVECPWDNLSVEETKALILLVLGLFDLSESDWTFRGKSITRR